MTVLCLAFDRCPPKLRGRRIHWKLVAVPTYVSPGGGAAPAGSTRAGQGIGANSLFIARGTLSIPLRSQSDPREKQNKRRHNHRGKAESKSASASPSPKSRFSKLPKSESKSDSSSEASEPESTSSSDSDDDDQEAWFVNRKAVAFQWLGSKNFCVQLQIGIPVSTHTHIHGMHMHTHILNTLHAGTTVHKPRCANPYRTFAYCLLATFLFP